MAQACRRSNLLCVRSRCINSKRRNFKEGDYLTNCSSAIHAVNFDKCSTVIKQHIEVAIIFIFREDCIWKPVCQPFQNATIGQVLVQKFDSVIPGIKTVALISSFWTSSTAVVFAPNRAKNSEKLIM